KCSLAEASLAPARATIAHRHNGTEEIYYFTAGYGKMSVEGKWTAVKAGDAVLIPAGSAHKLVNTGRTVMRLLCVCAPPYSHKDTEFAEPRFKLVVFDFDGTLVDTAPGIHATANAMAKLYGEHPVSMAKVTAEVGTGLDNFVTGIFPAQVRELGVDSVIRTYRRIYDEKYCVGLRLFPGVKRALSGLKRRGITLAIVSNKLKRYVADINRRLGIEKYFSAVLGSDCVKRKKPDPYPVNLLMKKYGADRRETLLVGDSKYDMEAGYRAGVAKFFLTYGYAVRKEAEKWKPDFVSGSFADVLKVVSWKQ
ncbi:MAG TPA: HAD-IIIA family hydrolase, partial [Candidatus Goldiibacteriota bacterium]|nr:HAD-IIIA family hydrolase [Candidatus Goldiibacteriota bacterium]